MGLVDQLLGMLMTVVPWGVALIASAVALFVVLKVKNAGVWAFVRSSPGHPLLLIKDTDGVGALRRATYYKDDSTLNPVGEKYEPFLTPSEHASMNIGGRPLFVAHRGLGSVQSFEGMNAMMMAKLAGMEGEDLEKVMDGNYEWETVPDGDGGKIRTGNIVVPTGDGNPGGKRFGGLVADLSLAKDFAPFNIQPEYAGAIRAAAYKRAAEKLHKTDFAKWVGIALTAAIVLAFAYILVASVSGGGASLPDVPM